MGKRISRTQETPETVPQFLTVVQVAQVLAISRAKAYTLVESGRLPCIRIDRCVRVSVVALNRWLEQQSA